MATLSGVPASALSTQAAPMPTLDSTAGVCVVYTLPSQDAAARHSKPVAAGHHRPRWHTGRFCNCRHHVPSIALRQGSQLLLWLSSPAARWLRPPPRLCAPDGFVDGS